MTTYLGRSDPSRMFTDLARRVERLERRNPNPNDGNSANAGGPGLPFLVVQDATGGFPTFDQNSGSASVQPDFSTTLESGGSGISQSGGNTTVTTGGVYAFTYILQAVASSNDAVAFLCNAHRTRGSLELAAHGFPALGGSSSNTSFIGTLGWTGTLDDGDEVTVHIQGGATAWGLFVCWLTVQQLST